MNDLHTGSDMLADELLQAYDEGKSIDELNEMLGERETESDEALPFTEESEETKEGETSIPEESQAREENEKGMSDAPFKVFNTQEDFQKDFDRQFNYRFRKEREAQEKKDREFEAFKAQVAEFLGVSPEKAIEELEARTIRTKAEADGVDAEILIREQKSAREIARLSAEIEKRDRQETIERAIRNIKAQGEELKKSFPGFNLDEAMEDEAFRSTCFSLYNLSPEDAVKKAFLACEGLGKFQKENSAKEARVSEGAARPNENSAVKKINIGSLTDKEVLDFERRILKGEKVDFT